MQVRTMYFSVQFIVQEYRGDCLTSESVEGSSLSLEGVDYIKSSNGLSSGVFGVGHRVSDDVLQERLENSSGLLVDES